MHSRSNKTKWKYSFPVIISKFKFSIGLYSRGTPMFTVGRRNIGYHRRGFDDANETTPGKATHQSICVLVWPGIHKTGLTSRWKQHEASTQGLPQSGDFRTCGFLTGKHLSSSFSAVFTKLWGLAILSAVEMPITLTGRPLGAGEGSPHLPLSSAPGQAPHSSAGACASRTLRLAAGLLMPAPGGATSFYMALRTSREKVIMWTS